MSGAVTHREANLQNEVFVRANLAYIPSVTTVHMNWYCNPANLVAARNQQFDLNLSSNAHIPVMREFSTTCHSRSRRSKRRRSSQRRTAGRRAERDLVDIHCGFEFFNLLLLLDLCSLSVQIVGFDNYLLTAKMFCLTGSQK